MFGYVTAQKSELKMREYYKYKAYYCGLCKVLQEKYGIAGQLTLTYDMTFLVILLTSLYETETARAEFRCVVHPLKKQKMLSNEFTEYAADMNLVLTYYKLLDDWHDEGSKTSLAGLKVLRPIFAKLKVQYPEKCEVIRKCLALLRRCEERGESNIDVSARYFGKLMEELFVYRKDHWESKLRRMGFYLGKFIYILDAYDDIDKDLQSGSYNAMESICADETFDEKVEEMLRFVMMECTSAFEMLPCVEDAEILRNILYAGVWDKFDKKRRGEESE